MQKISASLHSSSDGWPGSAGARIPLRQEPPCEIPDLGLLITAVQTEVIPRLLLSHTTPRTGTHVPDLADVEKLCALSINRDIDGALDHIDRLMAAGSSIESIYIHLLAATARLMGEMWEQDRLGFVDVTVGLCSLQQVLFRLGLETDPPEAKAQEQRRALFAPSPGESHLFGALIAARFFARAGWQTWTEVMPTTERLIELAREHEFDMVGLSLSASRNAGRLTDCVAGMRRALGPRMPAVLVGGHCFDCDPGMAARVGADIFAPDPATAIHLVETRLDSLATDH